MHSRQLVPVFLLLCGLVAPPAAPASSTLDEGLVCRKGLSKAGRKYAHKRRRQLFVCIDKLVKCELLSEVDSIDPNGCRGTAKSACDAKIGPKPNSVLSVAKQTYHDLATTACNGANFDIADIKSNVLGGLWFSNDPVCGTSTDVATLVDCLRDEIGGQVDGVVGRVKPRGGLLLDNVSLGGMTPVSLGSLFPDLLRPPTVEQIVTATLAGNCTLSTIGTISLASGTALRFVGDETTLPVGGGQNGKVTIRIGPGGDPCNDANVVEYILKEDYGANRAVTFGPFNGDQNYCITMRDGGGCNPSNTLTGIIDLP